MIKNKLLHIANLWSLTDYQPTAECTLEQKLEAVQAAGFDGFTTTLEPQHAREAQKRGLFVVGFFSSSRSVSFYCRRSGDSMMTHDPRFTGYADRTVHLFDGQIVAANSEDALSRVTPERCQMPN